MILEKIVRAVFYEENHFRNLKLVYVRIDKYILKCMEKCLFILSLKISLEPILRYSFPVCPTHHLVFRFLPKPGNNILSGTKYKIWCLYLDLFWKQKTPNLPHEIAHIHTHTLYSETIYQKSLLCT